MQAALLFAKFLNISHDRKFSELSKSRKDLEKEICMHLGYAADDQCCDDYVRFEEKEKSLDGQLFSVLKQIDALRKDLQENKCREKESIDRQIHWLMMELNTGGNIRLEAGSTECSWFNNCVKAVTSRFSTDDFAPFGITGVRVRTVSKVHNRLLQDCFQRATEIKKRKKHIEYLLYGETFQGSGELLSIVEEGFSFLSSKNEVDSTTPVFLSNSIGLADMCRLQKIFDQSQTSDSSKKKIVGWVLIVKANVGVSSRDQHVGDEFLNVDRSSYPDADSVYRMHPSDPTQRSWHIFDSSMLVPEYLVEYEYVLGNQSHHPGDKEEEMEGNFVLPTSKVHTFLERKNSVERHRGIKVHCISSHLIFQRHVKNEFVSHITHVNLHDSNIHELGSLKGLCNLKVLILSFNKISQVSSGEFRELKGLEILDLSYNFLKEIDGLAHLRHLKTLDLAGNQLTVMEELQSVFLQVPQLLQLNLRGNPIEEEWYDYKRIILKTLVSLVELDCVPIESSGGGGGGEGGSEPRKKMVEEILPGSGGGAGRRSQWRRLSDWRYEESGQVEEVKLEHERLKSMAFLADFPNVRKAMLSGNKIRLLQLPTCCKQLEELVLEDNCISEVEEDGCTAVALLWRLDLGRNQMTSCQPLSCFRALTQLSIERNRIQSLQGLQNLSSLLEVYAAHNMVADLEEVVHVAALPRLMVLDLKDNPLCADGEYRSYTIFSVRKIKVLDCRVVTPEEASAAHQMHEGRLRRHHLPPLVEHSVYSKELKLSRMGIRSCGTVFESPDLLRTLQELDLSNNLLSSIQPLRLLAKLKTLRLRNNHLKDGPLLLLSSPPPPPTAAPAEESASAAVKMPSPTAAADNATDVASITSIMQQQQQQSSAAEGCNSPTSDGRRRRCRRPQLACLGELENLELDGNAITNIMSLAIGETCPNLRMLSLANNSIAKVDGVGGLTRLQQLYLDHNCIKEIEPASFNDLGSLEELDLSHNAMKCVQHLGHLTSLRTLNLASNYLKPDRLGGFPITAEVSSLKNLRSLSLLDNPICRQPQYRCAVISKLMQLTSLDGRSITEEDVADVEHYVATLMELQNMSSVVTCDLQLSAASTSTSTSAVVQSNSSSGRLQVVSPNNATNNYMNTSSSNSAPQNRFLYPYYNCYDYNNSQNRSFLRDNYIPNPSVTTPPASSSKVALKVTPFHFHTTTTLTHSNRSPSIPNLLHLRPS